jgi:hypothetical protein
MPTCTSGRDGSCRQSLTQFREHRRAVRPHPAPDEKGLGRLLDQHAEAVGQMAGPLFTRQSR